MASPPVGALRAIHVAFASTLTLSCARPSTPHLPAEPLRIEAFGQELEVEPNEAGEIEEEFEPGAGSHAIGLFVGGSKSDEEETGFALGADYGYRLTDTVGVGAFAEGVSGIARSFSAGVQTYWVAPNNIVLFAGVGTERRNQEWEGILRIGVEYEIVQSTGWVIAPSIFYDIGETEDLLVYGLTIGRFL